MSVVCNCSVRSVVVVILANVLQHVDNSQLNVFMFNDRSTFNVSILVLRFGRVLLTYHCGSICCVDSCHYIHIIHAKRDTTRFPFLYARPSTAPPK
jgi:hypothetical protein